MNFVENLKWRGMLHDFIPETEKHLLEGQKTGYIGFDPSSNSLQLGNLVSIMILLHFQLAGHKPLALVGGATGMIGDPSGKSEERKLLSIDEIVYNQECIKKQLSKFLDFEKGSNSAEIVNNYDWFKEFSFLDFLRSVGKHITVNYMMAKDSVKNRLETGMSYTEFTYQLLQGYDFYHLNKEKNCTIQMGGADQWGNITTGVEFVRRLSGGNSVYALTTPLILKEDGTKFGKSEKGNIWLDPEKTSPYKFYQFWINCSDEGSKQYIRKFTLKSKDEIDALEAEHLQAPHLRILQKAIAEELTIRVHDKESLNNAINASGILFGDSTSEKLKTLEERTLLEIFEGVPTGNISQSQISEGVSIIDLLVLSGASPSKGEARRLISQGGLKINKDKCTNLEEVINSDYLLRDKFILIQKGKKNYHLVNIA